MRGWRRGGCTENYPIILKKYGGGGDDMGDHFFGGENFDRITGGREKRKMLEEMHVYAFFG
jgi:hypothetical protein